VFQDATLTEKFVITYTGQIYHGNQNISLFFSALNTLICNNLIDPDNLEVRFYGRSDPVLTQKIAEFHLESIVKQYGVIAHSESIKKQAESQVLLLLNWEDPTEKGVYPIKFFEYLAAHRPILATGGIEDDGVSEILQETCAGVTARSVQEIAPALLKYYSDYLKKGEVPYIGIDTVINSYDYREMARKYVSLF
jgi:hypothetical protein